MHKTPALIATSNALACASAAQNLLCLRASDQSQFLYTSSSEVRPGTDDIEPPRIEGGRLTIFAPKLLFPANLTIARGHLIEGFYDKQNLTVAGHVHLGGAMYSLQIQSRNREQWLRGCTWRRSARFVDLDSFRRTKTRISSGRRLPPRRRSPAGRRRASAGVGAASLKPPVPECQAATQAPYERPFCW